MRPVALCLAAIWLASVRVGASPRDLYGGLGLRVTAFDRGVLYLTTAELALVALRADGRNPAVATRRWRAAASASATRGRWWPSSGASSGNAGAPA